jgi:hypothetical protein
LGRGWVPPISRAIPVRLLVTLALAATGIVGCGGEDGGGGSNGVVECESGYDPCVPSYPPDVDCPQIDGPVDVTGSDPHGLDADNDGVGCES